MVQWGGEGWYTCGVSGLYGAGVSGVWLAEKCTIHGALQVAHLEPKEAYKLFMGKYVKQELVTEEVKETDVDPLG